MDTQDAIMERNGDVAILRMNRPERLNALSTDMLATLNAAIDEAGASGARALLLTGEGRAFCSGADLQGGAARGGGAADMGAGLERGVNPLLHRLANAPMPVLCAINGAAVGAGAGLALAGDMAIMGRSAFLLLAFTNVGLVPDAGLSYHLPRLAGSKRAFEMMMLNDRITADRAAEWGLVNRVVDDADLMSEALTLAHRLAAGPSKAFAILRQTVRRSMDGSFSDSLNIERVAQREAGFTADFQEGVRAFSERRKPEFRGN